MPDSNTYQKLMQNEATFASAALAIALEVLDPEFLTDWDPQTIELELNENLRTTVHPTVFNRLMAAINIIRSNAFYKSLPDFIVLVNALTGGISPGYTAMPDAFDVTWGITEGVLLWPPDRDDDEPFAPEIVDYIAAVLKREGIINPPDVLRLGLKEDTAELTAKIHAEFSDDPEMFNAIFDMESRKTQEIEEDLRDCLRTLARQLSQIHGDSLESSLQTLIKSMDAAAAESDELKPA